MHSHTGPATKTKTQIRWQGLSMSAVLILVAATAGWIWWAEEHPDEERALRVLVHQQLVKYFPEAMSIEQDAWYGLRERHHADPKAKAIVLLVHGLDEPGNIWDDLAPVLAEADFDVWELHYPNDQGIDRSGDYLSELWTELPRDRPIALIGHSMGGLVIRHFATTGTDTATETLTQADGRILGAILVGTPNQGSEWARLRIWLELRDHLGSEPERRFSLFAALRDGTGEAKIDLRPGSAFLESLNARTWPPDIPIVLIGGRLMQPTEAMTRNLATIGQELGSKELSERLGNWWSDLDEDLGDGVVKVESLRFPGGPEPILVGGSHRGMLLRFAQTDPEPSAIAPILTTLERWTEGISPH